MSKICRIVAVLLLGLPLAAQVVARQGSPADLQASAFTSPMILELPIQRLQAPESEDLFSFTDLDKFVCDDASLPLITIRRRFLHKPERVQLHIESTVFVRPSFDRKVTLRYSLVQGEKVLATAPDQVVSAKEKKYRRDDSSLVLPKEAFDQLFQGEPKGVLKVVLSVAPDR